MIEQDLFRSISPLDHRYYWGGQELFERLRDFLSEDACVRALARVEAALLKTHVRFQREAQVDSAHASTENAGESEGAWTQVLAGKALEEWYAIIDSAAEAVSAAAVYADEARTRHHVRALVRVFSAGLPRALQPLVHLGATSADVQDTAQALRLRGCTRRVLLPLLIRLEGELVRIVLLHADTLQLGRTHGQFAVPTTLGHNFASFVSRLGGSIREIDARSRDLPGQLSGAVGAYNAVSLVYPDPQEFEAEFLELLALKACEHSTQIVQPEALLRLVLELNIAFGIVANLADDLRHLQRSEIDELREFFSAEQVGSSTMPQKRNPWNSEHVKSLWKAFSPRVQSLFMDQISEHQRDLTNSASSRFIAEYFAGFAAALDRMCKILSALFVNTKAMRENLERAGSAVYAEALYVMLAQAGMDNAHERIRRITLRASEEGTSLLAALEAHAQEYRVLSEFVQSRGLGTLEEFLSSPRRYSGKSAEQARKTAESWQANINTLEEKLQSEEQNTDST